jgi:hypothetical protein
MNDQNYSATITAHITPQEAFNYINDVTKWWTDDFEGHSHKLDDEFTVRFKDIHVSSQKLVELVPDKKVVWLVTDSKLNFIKDTGEWTGTKINFEISQDGDKTVIHFTHIGLVPAIECYNACTNGWDYYIKGSLQKLLTRGQGTPGLEKNAAQKTANL